MEEKISESDIKLLDSIVGSLNIAIESSALYNPSHPEVENAIKNLREKLNSWFTSNESLSLGVSSDNLLLKDTFVKKDSSAYKVVADYLHQRGILCISISKEVEFKELFDFFKLISRDPKIIKTSGGIIPHMPAQGHIIVKEIDYRRFLEGGESVGASVTEDERNIWQELVSSAASTDADVLPASKFDFIMNFLKDRGKSASLLNKVYREALAKLEGKTVVDNFRNTFAQMLSYVKRLPADSSREIKKELADVLSGLNPNFVASLFTEGPQHATLDLAQDFLKDLPEDTITSLMASLIDSEGRMSDNLFKLFDRFVPADSTSDSLVVTLADKLFEKKLLNKDTLSQLQVSIKEIFEANSNNQFISQMYRLTVESLIDKSVSGKAESNAVSILARECLESLEESRLLKQEIRLLLNILWLENDPGEFKKFCEILAGVSKRIIEPVYLTSVKEIFEFFCEKLSSEQSKNAEITGCAKSVLSALTDKTAISRIQSFMPKLTTTEIQDVCYILSKAEGAVDYLLAAYALRKDEASRGIICSVILSLGSTVAKNVSLRLQDGAMEDSSSVTELFGILKKLDPQEAHRVAQKMVQSKNPDTRLMALDSFVLDTEVEHELMFEVFKREESPFVKEKIIDLLVQTNNPMLLERLFTILRKVFFDSNYLLKYIRACGDFSATQAMRFLERVALRRPFFDSTSKRELRVAAVVSLGEIATPEAKVVLEKTLHDKSESVRRMSELVLESYRTKNQQEENEQ